MTFPATLETLVTDIAGTQTTSARTHAQVHDDVNAVVNALQIKVGTDGSTDVDSLDYKLHHLTTSIIPSILYSTNIATDGYVPSKAIGLDKFTWIPAGSGGGGTGSFGAYIEEFTATAGQTTFNLAHSASSTAMIRVSTRSGLLGKQGLTRDYTVATLNQIIFNTPLLVGDVITVQYISGFNDPLTPTSITANGTGIYTSIATQPRQVFKNGLYQLITVDWSYVGTTLTFTNATSITDTIIFIY